jgi:putative acetyltransferase
MTIVIREETAADHGAVGDVIRQAFGQDDEVRLVAALRDFGCVQVALLADDDGEVVGHVLFSDLPIVTADGAVAALALAPLAVSPSRQRRGIGTMLVREGLRACRQRGHRVVVVLGHPGYYPRFGFSAALARPLQSPFSGEAFQALELVPGALNGVVGEVRYAPPFHAF